MAASSRLGCGARRHAYDPKRSISLKKSVGTAIASFGFRSHWLPVRLRRTNTPRTAGAGMQRALRRGRGHAAPGPPRAQADRLRRARRAWHSHSPRTHRQRPRRGSRQAHAAPGQAGQRPSVQRQRPPPRSGARRAPCATGRPRAGPIFTGIAWPASVQEVPETPGGGGAVRSTPLSPRIAKVRLAVSHIAPQRGSRFAVAGTMSRTCS
jgi:hypothetical protein